MPWCRAIETVMVGLQYSGMRKRTALAQIFVLDLHIIVMDEPFNALDIQTQQLMKNEVLKLWARKIRAVLFITLAG